MAKGFSFKGFFNNLYEDGTEGTIIDRTPTPPSGKTEWIFGRSTDCDFVYSVDRVSRRHFKIQLIDNHFYITDLGSTNGTFVNGMPVTRMERIFSGDVISMGSTDIVFDAALLV
ncbi:MAG: FHA domain-containing protein [Oscillospiraceae bacterium]|nr:FHA domain-containing protein [Oscillospiraceae bacterium]